MFQLFPSIQREIIHDFVEHRSQQKCYGIVFSFVNNRMRQINVERPRHRSTKF